MEWQEQELMLYSGAPKHWMAASASCWLLDQLSEVGLGCQAALLMPLLGLS